MQYAKARLIIAKGHRMMTIQGGGTLSGSALLSLLPQYQSAATHICCDPWTAHARRLQTSVAAPLELPISFERILDLQGGYAPLPLQNLTQRTEKKPPRGPRNTTLRRLTRHRELDAEQER
jgi:hypothetical protein